MNNVRKGLNFIYLEPTPPNNERAKEREKEWAKERKEEWKKEWRTSKTNHLKYPPFILKKCGNYFRVSTRYATSPIKVNNKEGKLTKVRSQNIMIKSYSFYF